LEIRNPTPVKINMKTIRKLIYGLAVAAAVFSLVASARAGIFTWSSPTAISTADTTLNQSGTVVGAETFGAIPELVVLSNGTILDFKADGSVATATGNGIAYSGFTNDTGNAAFNVALTEFTYDGGPSTITLNNLVIGQQYSVQLFACDRRNGIRSTLVVNFQDPSDATDVSANFQMGSYDYVVGTFTATATTQNIQENMLNSNAGNINALVLRAIGANVPPQITTQPAANSVYQGWNASLTAAATGTGTLTYHWQKSNVGGSVFTNLVNSSHIGGATNYSLSLSNLVVSDTADYQVVVSSTYGAVTSSPAATLTVLTGAPQFVWSAPVAITTADATLNQSGTIVGAATFDGTEEIVTLTNTSVVDFKADGSVATATGNGAGSGAFLADTGNANFNATLTQASWDGGPKTITLNNLIAGQQYSVQLFALDDSIGASDNSNPFRMASFQDPADPFDISSTISMGDLAYIIGTFTASNSTVNLQENLPLSGNGNLNALVIRALGVIVAPSVTTAPASVTIDQGLSTTFSVAASGSTPLTYQWQRGVVGSGIFTNVPANARYSGLTGSTLTISNLAVGDGADYQVIVANAGGSVTSTPPATLAVQAVTPRFVWSLPRAITSADATLNQSGTIVGAAVFGSTPAIVVLTNGTSVDFQTNASVATATGAGTTTGAFSGNTGNAGFSAVLNQFNYDNGPKTITLNNLVVGQQYTVQLFALDDRAGANTRTVNFQDPADSLDYSATFAMPDNVYTVGTFTASDSSMNIQENLFGSGGNINAAIIRRLTGLPLAPAISTQPESTAVFAGSTAQLTVGANGTALTYQWQRAATGSGSYANVSNGGAVSGATTAQLTIANAASANAADYRVIVSNGSGSVTSSPAATLTVRATVATLIHRWNFNETSGSTAHDSIGEADGTLVNGTGTSVSFNGTGQLVLNNPGLQTTGAGSYVTLPGGLVTSLSAVTFELWYNNTGLNNGNPLVSFGGPVDGTTFHGTNFINFFARWAGSTTAFEIQTFAGDSGVVTLGARQQSGTFHWVLIYDPIAGTVSAYLNGTLQASASGITIPLSTVGTGVGYIGLSAWNQIGGNSDPNLPTGSFSSQYGFNGNGNYPYLNANMDEMRIYDGVLNTNAIAATQLLGPDTLLSNTAKLSTSASGESLSLVWPIANGGFTLESSPVLGSGAVWTPVSGTKSVVGSNYQITISTTNAAAFFRLRE
jgi:hypothetical protein